MSVETTPEGDVTDDDVTELAESLGEAITELPAYQEFVEAKAAVENDEELQDEIREFERIREEFMMARQTGDATNDDLRELQSAQQELHEKPKMAKYLQAQSEIELTLQELNVTISEPLEVDFGEKAGGCCQD
ncbi:YlbF family regulator [Natronomonas gomsonensis]|jgi:cell fate (sporulation/competence/biofilm development) regulator YlbF (YheA/YmcA/DUF963 family)|uniref:YlbF family regulator n=1 Tax=Natronomonas gomsonensis TaxID=1046043 RepID=UPI0020CA73B5|nr:YlbF family regulator [Natronomonas gomsonensis]MCY4731997.1 YlbF family regulator [Natronomonas gomsonensis]